MDPALREAARALAAFQPLAALRVVALRKEPAALALRGVAMAQLGELARARQLLRRAALALRAEPAARARCLAAEAEVALAARDLGAARKGLARAAALLEAHGDRGNAVFVRLQQVRCSLWLGRPDEAERTLAALALRGVPARTVALVELLRADVAARRLRARAASAALERARRAAEKAALPALTAEVEAAVARLAAPVALVCRAGVEPLALALGDVERLLASRELVVDACRRQVSAGGVAVSLATRPVLLALAVALAELAPEPATREALMRRAFAARVVNESLRARLRVEIGRLRRALSGLADIQATADGFRLSPKRAPGVCVLVPPSGGEASALLALLSSGEAWATSALASALGTSQRAVQRALVALEADGRVRASGGGRARRWLAPPPSGFATTLLLVAREPLG